MRALGIYRSIDQIVSVTNVLGMSQWKLLSLWYVKPFILVDSYQNFGVICRFHLEDRRMREYKKDDVEMETGDCSEVLVAIYQTTCNHF